MSQAAGRFAALLLIFTRSLLLLYEHGILKKKRQKKKASQPHLTVGWKQLSVPKWKQHPRPEKPSGGTGNFGYSQTAFSHFQPQNSRSLALQDTVLTSPGGRSFWPNSCGNVRLGCPVSQSWAAAAPAGPASAARAGWRPCPETRGEHNHQPGTLHQAGPGVLEDSPQFLGAFLPTHIAQIWLCSVELQSSKEVLLHRGEKWNNSCSCNCSVVTQAGPYSHRL